MVTGGSISTACSRARRSEARGRRRRGALRTRGAPAAARRPSAPATTAPPAARGRHPVVERCYGKGGDSVWVFHRQSQRSEGGRRLPARPRTTPTESTPLNHSRLPPAPRGRGDAVVYPRFESVPGRPRAVLHALKGTVAGMRALNPAHDRAGRRHRLLARRRPRARRRRAAPGRSSHPEAVLSVFPAMLDPPLDYRSIPPTHADPVPRRRPGHERLAPRPRPASSHFSRRSHSPPHARAAPRSSARRRTSRPTTSRSWGARRRRRPRSGTAPTGSSTGRRRAERLTRARKCDDPSQDAVARSGPALAWSCVSGRLVLVALAAARRARARA